MLFHGLFSSFISVNEYLYKDIYNKSFIRSYKVLNKSGYFSICGLVTKLNKSGYCPTLKKAGDKMKKKKQNFNAYLVGEEQLKRVKPKISDLRGLNTSFNPVVYGSSSNILRALILKNKFKEQGKYKTRLELNKNFGFILK